MMRRGAFIGAALACSARPAWAQTRPVRIGFVTTYSGPIAEISRTQDAAIATFMRQYGDSVAGRKIEIIRRDEVGPAPEVARRIAQELVVDQNVDYLAGFIFTPNAIAAGQIATQAKRPMLLINSPGPGVLDGNPYGVRLNFTTPQVISLLARWAPKNGFPTLFILTLDNATGIQTSTEFATAYTAAGGRILGEVRAPAGNTDFSSYMQRIKEAMPAGIFTYVVSGGNARGCVKAFVDSGLPAAGVRLLSGPDLASEENFDSIGDGLLGTISSGNYTPSHASRVNADFVRLMARTISTPPDYICVAAYDMMGAIYKTIQRQNGVLDGDRTMALLRGLKLESPRGPVQIDAKSRDMLQNIYIRRVEREGNKLVNREIVTFTQVDAQGRPAA